MIYKIGKVSEISSIPIEQDKAKEWIYHFTQILESEYGAERDINSVGGYVIYAPKGATTKEIKDIFDYTENFIELSDIVGDACYAMYLLGDDYGVVIVASIDAMPVGILKEIIKQKGL
jgi:hypothetical protein